MAWVDKCDPRELVSDEARPHIRGKVKPAVIVSRDERLSHQIWIIRGKQLDGCLLTLPLVTPVSSSEPSQVDDLDELIRVRNMPIGQIPHSSESEPVNSHLHESHPPANVPVGPLISMMDVSLDSLVWKGTYSSKPCGVSISTRLGCP